MAKHKKKRKRLHLRRSFILLIALLLLFGGFACHYRDAIRRRLFPQDPNANGETVLTEIADSGNLQADTAVLTSRGDILKVDYIQPGLDTYTLFTAIHAVSDGRNLSRIACGTDDFTTGLTANGFFVGRLSDRAIGSMPTTRPCARPSKRPPTRRSASSSSARTKAICFITTLTPPPSASAI